MILEDYDKSREWSRYNWFNSLRAAGIQDTELLQALAEAWQWLASKCLIAINHLDGGDAAFITKSGREALVLGLDRMRAAERLDVHLHPAIATTIRRQFLLGEYELAAFAAMREVEVAVRRYAGASNSDIGVKLINKAFHPDTGPLADAEQDPGERAATMDLFRGAIGVFKNPSSHRIVDYNDPTLASEVVLFADLLLRILDRSMSGSA